MINKTYTNTIRSTKHFRTYMADNKILDYNGFKKEIASHCYKLFIVDSTNTLTRKTSLQNSFNVAYLLSGWVFSN